MTELSDVVLDFDGTCTQVPVVAAAYLEEYRKRLRLHFANVTVKEWAAAITAVRRASPHAGWAVAGPPGAPAAADPYILADEATRYLLRERGLPATAQPKDVHSPAYDAHPAPWRPEAAAVLADLIGRGIRLHFISNSGSAAVAKRVAELFPLGSPEAASIGIHGNASKFCVVELAWDRNRPRSTDSAFRALPAGVAVPGLRRPVYLRRGNYFETLLAALDGDHRRIRKTLFCGDIWEMDLAMPLALGAAVHLVYRAPPFSTCAFERRLALEAGARARASRDLRGLLAWF